MEPGVYLLPGGAVDSLPPEIPEDKLAKYKDGVWTLIPKNRGPLSFNVPKSVTRFQALAALHQKGVLPQVQAIMSSPEIPVLTKLAWDNALSFERESPLLNMLAATFNLTDSDLDELFFVASQITA